MRPILCSACGYLMDCTTPTADVNGAPKQGDIGMCPGCGSVYLLDGAWTLISERDWQELPDDVRAYVTSMQARTHTIRPALTDRSGHA